MQKKSRYKRIICFDFDGVIHSYQSGWFGAGVIKDEPVPGAKEILQSLAIQDNIQLCVFSARNKSLKGRRAIRKYLIEKVGLQPFIVKEIRLPLFKPHALVYIDDRGILFEGKFPSIKDILEFKPWNWRTQDAA